MTIFLVTCRIRNSDQTTSNRQPSISLEASGWNRTPVLLEEKLKHVVFEYSLTRFSSQDAGVPGMLWNISFRCFGRLGCHGQARLWSGNSQGYRVQQGAHCQIEEDKDLLCDFTLSPLFMGSMALADPWRDETAMAVGYVQEFVYNSRDLRMHSFSRQGICIAQTWE